MKMNTWLLQTLIQKFGDLDLAIKLARGFLVLYKVNCGSGEGAPFKITSQNNQSYALLVLTSLATVTPRRQSSKEIT